VTFVFRMDNELRLTSWLFLKLLALIFFAAFVSLYGQIAGLVGPNGILPLGEFQDYLFQRYGRHGGGCRPSSGLITAMQHCREQRLPVLCCR